MATTGGKGGTYQAAYQSGATQADASRFKVKIFSPYQTYFQGEAVSLSAVNATGPFDILAGHANFMSLLSPGTVRVDTGFQKLEFPMDRGLLRVNHHGVTLFAGV